MTTLNEKLRAARIRLSGKEETPYFAPALWAVRMVESKDCLCPVSGTPTMGVSRDWTFYYHPDFEPTAGIDVLCTIWLHEIGHLLRKHAERAEACGVTAGQHTAWNIAADCEINDGLVEQHRPFPVGLSPCLPAMLKMPNDLTAEEYYHSMSKSATAGKGQGQGQSGKDIKQDVGGSAGDGVNRPWEKGTVGKDGKAEKHPIPADLIRKQIAEAIQKQANERGSIPGSLKRWAGQLLAPVRVPWEVVFRSIIGQVIAAGKKDEYTFSLPTRREEAGGFIMPGQYGTLPEVAVGIDTSGSMGTKALVKAISVLESVLEHLGKHAPINILAGDARVAETKKVLSGRNVELLGGGGTDMRELITAADTTLRPHPQAFVLVTDGETPWPTAPCHNMQLVVVLVRENDSVPTWAKVVLVNEEN